MGVIKYTQEPETLSQLKSNKTAKVSVHKPSDPHMNLSADRLIQVALQHKDENRVEWAIETLSKAMQQHNDAQLHAVRGSIYLELGKSKLALIDFEKGLNLEPNDTLLLINRAQVYRRFGQISGAINDLNKALSITPDSLAALFNRGSIYYSSGDYNLALADFDQCIAINPHSPAAYFNRANTYKLLDKTNKAIEDLERFIELNKNTEWNKTANTLLIQFKQELVSDHE